MQVKTHYLCSLACLQDNMVNFEITHFLSNIYIFIKNVLLQPYFINLICILDNL